MPNNPQAMEITPRSEITFRGPYTEVVESVLRLGNPTQRPMAFKVKTTAPKQYCVRPNSGHLAAGESRDIVVMLQPLPNGQPTAETSKHKFLVQTCFVPAGETNIDAIWKTVSADEMMDTKLRVNFDQLMSAAAAGGATSATTFVSQSVVNDSFSGDAKHTSQDTQAGDGEKRRLVDELERSKAENAKLLRTNKDLMSQLTRSAHGGGSDGDMSTSVQFKAWQLAVASLIALVFGIILAKVI